MPGYDPAALAHALPRLRDDVERSRALANRATERARRLAEEAMATRRLLAARQGWRQQRADGSVWDAAAEVIAQADRDRDRQLGTLAHELRQPLAAAMAAERLLRSGDTQSAARAQLILGRQLQHLSELVGNLLEYSRVTLVAGAAKHERVDAREIVAEAVDTVAPSAIDREHTIAIAPADAPVPIVGDRTRLRQAVVNLLQNAVRYTPREGHIDVAVGADDTEAWIEVRDTGEGIPAERLADIFEPFVRVSGSGPGLGIGLALVRRIADMHGGRIVVESAGAGCGSRFRLVVPRASAPEEP